MNDSVSESVDDNGNQRLDSMENVSVNGGDDHEESVGSPQQSNKTGDSVKVESPGGSVNSKRKGFGLKKWRRIKRDGPVVKDEGGAPVDDGSKLLKRGLTGFVNPPSKHVDLSSVEARQSSEGSVGSVNMVHHQHHAPGVVNGFSLDPGFMFNLGQAFEKSEEISGKNVGGKVVSGINRKGSEERVKTKKEKPSSSLDSDLRSSGFVFSSGAVSVANYGEKDERLMNHFAEFSKGQAREDGRTYSENGDREEDGDKSKNNNRYWADKDLIADSIRDLAALQEVLWKEVQSFQELGKESISVDSNIDELSSSNQTRNENSGSQVLILNQKVKHLEHKLEEARAVLEAKEAKIQELENSKMESETEGIFKRRIETEIVHLVLTRSLKSLRVSKQSKEVHFATEDLEPNQGNTLGKTCKFGFYFFTQMILLLSILRFLVLQYSPASSLVIPT